MKKDFINPMVIKELRQGLKSRIFLASFLGLQGLMVLSMFIYLSVANSGNGSGDMDIADGFFWFVLGLMLLVSMPFRAFQALYEELKGNTMEMLFLTRMNAWNIAFGKWCALVLQIFLLVSAVLPYLVLRYFLGSIDVIGNLQILVGMVLGSMVLVAIGVGLSAWTSKLLRGLVLIGTLFCGFWLVEPVYDFFYYDVGGSIPAGDWVHLLFALMVAGLMMVFFVEYGASQIAPPAENHAVRKRLMALTLAGVMSLYALFIIEAFEMILVCMLLLIPVAIDALCEPLIGIKSIYLNLRKFGIFRWFFYPGWVSGWLFVTCLYFILLAIVMAMDGDDEIFIFGLIAYNTLIFPFVWMRLIPPLTRKPLVAYYCLQGLCLGCCLFTVFLEEIRIIDGFYVFSHLMPMLGFFVLGQWNAPDLNPILLFFPMTVMMTLIWVKSLRPLRQMVYLSRGGKN